MISLFQKREDHARKNASRCVVMPIKIALLLSLMLSSPLLVTSVQAQTKVDVFTSNQYPIVDNRTRNQKRDFVVVIYNLDAVNNFFKTLNIPVDQNNPQAAQAELDRIFPENPVPGQTDMRRELLEKSQGEVLARQYKIRKYPAVVFNSGKEVVYGMTDLQQAINLYNESQR